MTFEDRSHREPGRENASGESLPQEVVNPESSQILDAFLSLKEARAQHLRERVEIPVTQVLWNEAKTARERGDDAQALTGYRNLLAVLDPTNRQDGEFFAAAICHSADILLRQNKIEDARLLLSEFDQKSETLPLAFRPWAILLNATSRQLEGELSDAQIERTRFRKALGTSPDKEFDRCCRASDNAIKAMVSLSCESLATQVVGDVIEILERGRERVYPELYVTYLLAHARLLVQQERANESYERISACRDAVNEIFFADEQDVALLHEQMATLLVDIGMFSEALKERQVAAELADSFGDTRLTLSNRIEKMRLHYLVGDDAGGNAEFRIVRDVLIGSLPRWFFAEIRKHEGIPLSLDDQEFVSPAERKEFCMFAGLYSRLLLIKMSQTMDDGSRLEETLSIAEQVARIEHLLGDEKIEGIDPTVLCIARVASQVYARQPSRPEDLIALESDLERLSEMSPRFGQIQYLLAIQKFRSGDYDAAEEHFIRSESIYSTGNVYRRTAPVLQLLSLKSLYLLDDGRLPEAVEVAEQALELREELGVLLSEHGKINLEFLVWAYQTLGDDERVGSFQSRLEDVTEYLSRA